MCSIIQFLAAGDSTKSGKGEPQNIEILNTRPLARNPFHSSSVTFLLIAGLMINARPSTPFMTYALDAVVNDKTNVIRISWKLESS